jgi:hypothetical protein
VRVLIIGGSTGGVCVAQGSQATPRRTAQCWRLNDGKDVGEMAEHVEPGGVCARDDGHGVGEPLALLLARGQATDRSRAIELLEEALARPPRDRDGAGQRGDSEAPSGPGRWAGAYRAGCRGRHGGRGLQEALLH